MRREPSNRPLAALILGGIFIGFSPIFVRLSTVGPLTTAFWRLSLALIPLAGLSRLRSETDDQRKHPRLPAEHILAALPGVFLAGDLAVWHVSLHLTSVADATLLANMAPIFVTLASWLILRQPIRRAFLVGLALSLVGIIVLKGGIDARGDGHILGDVLALTASAFYAGYILVVGWARKKFQAGPIMLWSTVSAAICTLPVAMTFEREFFPATLTGWANPLRPCLDESGRRSDIHNVLSRLAARRFLIPDLADSTCHRRNHCMAAIGRGPESIPDCRRPDRPRRNRFCPSRIIRRCAKHFG